MRMCFDMKCVIFLLTHIKFQTVYFKKRFLSDFLVKIQTIIEKTFMLRIFTHSWIGWIGRYSISLKLYEANP